MSAASQSSEEGEEITAQEYARLNDLAYNHLAEHISGPYDTMPLPSWFANNPTMDSHLPHFEFLDHDTDERLSVSKEAAIMIAWVSNVDKVNAAESNILSVVGYKEAKNKKLELPLLESDHEKDYMDFAKRKGFELELKDVKLPLEVIDEEKKEGLGFPASLWKRGDELMEELRKEKLAVTKEAIICLQQSLKIDWDKVAEQEVWASVQTYRRVFIDIVHNLLKEADTVLQKQALEPVTPPLSPMALPVKPFEPSSSDPAFQLLILSDPPSLIKEDLMELEKSIFEIDIPTPIRNAIVDHNGTLVDACSAEVEINLGEIYSPLASMDGITSPPSAEHQRMKWELLKIEETLTPPNPSPISKAVHFSNIVEEMVFRPASLSELDAFESTFFEDAFGDAGERAMRSAEQETLVAADAISRIGVPIMDFSTSDPPWKIFESQKSPDALLNLQMSLIRDTIGHKVDKWPASKQVDMQLKWNPFPHNIAQVALEEEFDANDEHWRIIVNGAGDADVIDTSTLTWKPSGLRILQDDDEDDEIELGRFSNDVPPNLLYLVKKRKLEIEEGRDQARLENPVKHKSMLQDLTDVARTEQVLDDNSGLLGSGFSIGNALDNFLELRGTKKQKLAESSYLAVAPKDAIVQARTDSRMSIQLPNRSSPIADHDPLPLPLIRPSNIPLSIIVSSPLLRNRALIKRLETNLPRLRIVERDFTSHNTTAWMPNSVKRSPISPPLSSEADIIISPSTGVILTTLQKIKQKPLPGQKTKPAVRDQLERVSVRYEKLIVLISEGMLDETTCGIDVNDCQALSEFIGFTVGLNTSITVHFVGGGEETLSKWLISSIVQHAQDKVDLLDDETHWELFLRRAGFNAFAAQAIIVDLKAPEGVDPQSPSKVGHFGVIAFVEMGSEQRSARFAKTCGKKLMERVSIVLDAKWG
jgi:hypothetical protein